MDLVYPALSGNGLETTADIYADTKHQRTEAMSSLIMRHPRRCVGSTICLPIGRPRDRLCLLAGVPIEEILFEVLVCFWGYRESPDQSRES